MPPLSRPETLVRCLVLAPGLLVAPVFLPTSTIVILMVLGTSMTASALVLLDRDHAPAGSGHHADPLTATAAGGLAAVSLAAATGASPALGLLVLLAGLLCSRTLRCRATRRWAPAHVVRAPAAAPEACAPVVPRQRTHQDRFLPPGPAAAP